MNDTIDDLLRLTHKLLESITQGDWATYRELCDPSLTAFEPEAMGQLVEGLPFHEFYFELGGTERGLRQTTLCSPKVRVMGDAAVVCYVRLTQGIGPGGEPFTTAGEETRVWQRQAGQWKLVHFHRSPAR
jgi:calcium/calmodulin-dependent protein kinase (CaM kinase) II